MLKCSVNDDPLRRFAAITKIKNHITRCGNDPCEITPAMATYWWKLLNRAVFNNILQTPIRFETKSWLSEAGVFGECQSWGSVDNDPDQRKVVIRLKNKMQSRKLFLIILVHEMVHQWEWQMLGRTTHHKFFYMWRETIYNTVGLPLTTYVNEHLDD